jgi:plasmid stabilization system protein ParE
VKSVIFRPAAAADVDAAFAWYEERRLGLGHEFLDVVSATQASVAERPESFPVIHRDTRRALLPRFPYALYYRIYGDRIVVVACMHARRHPKRWISRLDG